MIIPYVTKGQAPVYQLVIAWLFLVGTTLLARYGKNNYDSKLKRPYFKVSESLIFVVLSYLYMMAFEFFANVQSWGTPGWFMQHMTYHIFDNTIGIVVPVFLLGLILQRYKIGLKTTLACFGAGLGFAALGPHPSSNWIGAVINSAFFIWVYHFSWFYTTLLAGKVGFLSKLKR